MSQTTSLTLLRAGDSSEYGRLFDQYGLDLFRLAAGIVWNETEAEDIVQDTFIRLLDTAQRNQLRGSNGSIFAFLRKTARNLAIDRLRRKQTRQRYEKDAKQSESPFATPETNPFECLEGKEIENRLMTELGNLPDLQRAAFVLRVVHGESYQEIAQALEISQESVKTHISRARNKLRPVLADYGG